MVAFQTQLLAALRARFSRHAQLEAENLILRQQLIVLRRRHPGRMRLWNVDRLLFVWLYRLYPGLLDAILIVKPETVIRWHRRGFALIGAGGPVTLAAGHGLRPRYAH